MLLHKGKHRSYTCKILTKSRIKDSGVKWGVNPDASPLAEELMTAHGGWKREKHFFFIHTFKGM